MRPLSRSLRVGHKLALASAAFSLPIAVLLWFHVAQVSGDIRFSRLETYGNAYERPLIELLRLVSDWVLVAEGERSPAQALSGLKKELDTALNRLDEVDARVGQDLQFTAEGLALRKREHLRPQTLRRKIQGLEVIPRDNMDAVRQSAADILADVREMVTHAGDTSNLILDPDLDSYYMMDVTLLALPQTMDRLGRMLDFLQSLRESGTLGEEERGRIRVDKALLHEADYERVMASLQTALNEDPNFYTVLDSLHKEIPPAMATYDRATSAFLAALEDLASSGAADMGHVLDLGRAARKSAFDLWFKSVDQLDLLLDVRIADKELKRVIALATTGTALLAALVLVAFISRSVIRPLGRVVDFARKVGAGDMAQTLSGDFSGELGELSDQVSQMVRELKIRLGFAQGILNGISYPCLVLDPDNRITYMNDDLVSLFDKKGRGEDYVGRMVGDFFFDDPSRKTRSYQANVERTRVEGEFDYTTDSGRRLRLNVVASPIFDLEGAHLGVFTLYFDLTRIREQEAKILAQKEAIGHAAAEVEEIVLAVGQALSGLTEQVATASRGAESQRAKTREASLAMEEMNTSFQEVTRGASEAAQQADQTRGMAQEGSEVVRNALEAIQHVAETSERLRRDMQELSSQATAIGRIITTINDIADQTNLLALNAAIEAARAGEAGRGFAVVADEVRKLAEKTMTATREVGDAVSSIQQGTRKSGQGMDEAQEAVRQATGLAESSGQALHRILGLVTTTSSQVAGIAAASQQQSGTTARMEGTMSEINDISEITAQGMGLAEEAIGRLNMLSTQLRELTVRLRDQTA